MSEERTPADHQAIADLENVMPILLLEREKDKSNFSAEMIENIESVLDKYSTDFEVQKDAPLTFAQILSNRRGLTMIKDQGLPISEGVYIKNRHTLQGGTQKLKTQSIC